MRVLALDIGVARIGIAISDSDGLIAQPLCVLSANEVTQHSKAFVRILQDWEPDVLLCGLPLSLSGSESEHAQATKKTAQLIAKNTHLPLEFTDERLSSKQAKRILRERGLSEKQMRGKIDAVAASVFLQSWLDEKRNTDEA